jgi:predicted HTH transcriptional regulator
MAEQNSLDDLNSLIQWPREERNLEFKRSMDWADTTTKAKLTKSVLAMANVRDGGHIVLGVERQSDDSYVAVGMQPDHFRSFVQDQISSHLSEYADPYVEATLIKHLVNGRMFCVIRVGEFAELPAVCKKDGLEKLHRGATYTRSPANGRNSRGAEPS